MPQRTLRIIATLSILAIGSLAGFMAWSRSKPLIVTHLQAFQFEPHPRTLEITGRRPTVAATVTGSLYLLSVESSSEPALALRMSHDAGEHWMPPTSLSSPGTAVTTSSENAPQLLAHGMYAFALWQQKSGDGETQLRLARSSGMDSKPPVSTSITDKAANDNSYSGFASFTVAPNGDIYVVWLDGRDKTSAGTFNVYLARSTDRGATFHHNVRVATLACPCCRPSVSVSQDGHVYVAYRHVYSDNERDIAVATSTDAGEHFNEPVRVSTDRWRLFGCPESGPVAAVQGNKLVVAWYTAAEDNPGIRIAASNDEAKSFLRPILISKNIQSANHPFLTLRDDGTTAIVFSGRPPSTTGTWEDLTPFIFRIDSDGHISSTTQVPADSSGDRYPTASLSPDGDAYVVWSNATTGKTYLARATSK